MSEYWEAVRRAALGLPGAAEPRPRAMYEPDEPLDAAAELDVVEEEVDALPSPRAPAPATLPALAATLTAKSPAQETPPGPSPAPPPTPAANVTHEPSVRYVEAQSPQPEPAPAGEDDGTPTPPPPWHTIAQIEVHRLEGTRTVIEPGEMASPPASTDTAGRIPSAHEPARHPPTPVEPAASAAEVSSVIVTEPLGSARPPAPLEPAPEPPPLVIEIGRIEIRIAPETAVPPAPPRRRESGTALSLDAYLARRSEAAR